MKGLLFSLCIGPAVPHLWCSAAPQTASWTLEARKKAALFLSWTASHTSNPGECSRMGVLTHFYFLIVSRVMQRIPSGTNTMRRLWLTELRTGDESAPINSLTCSVWLRGLFSNRFDFFFFFFRNCLLVQIQHVIMQPYLRVRAIEPSSVKHLLKAKTEEHDTSILIKLPSYEQKLPQTSVSAFFWDFYPNKPHRDLSPSSPCLITNRHGSLLLNISSVLLTSVISHLQFSSRSAIQRFVWWSNGKKETFCSKMILQSLIWTIKLLLMFSSGKEKTKLH